MPDAFRSVSEYQSALKAWMSGPTVQQRLDALTPEQRYSLGAEGVAAAYAAERGRQQLKLKEFTQMYGGPEDIASIPIRRSRIPGLGPSPLTTAEGEVPDEMIWITPQQALSHFEEGEVTQYMIYQDQMEKLGIPGNKRMRMDEWRASDVASAKEYITYQFNERQKPDYNPDKIQSYSEFTKAQSRARMTAEEKAHTAGLTAKTVEPIKAKERAIAHVKAPEFINKLRKTIEKSGEYKELAYSMAREYNKDRPKEEQKTPMDMLSKAKEDLLVKQAESELAGLGKYKFTIHRARTESGDIDHWVINRGKPNEFKVPLK